MGNNRGGALSLVDLSKSYNQVSVVESVSLDVIPGKLLTLLGPSGCGKTTVLRLIGGFVSPTAGRVIVDGKDITDLLPEQRHTGMVFQNYALFPHLNVRGNVAFGLKMRKVPADRIDARVREVLAMVRMEGFQDRYPSELSGGQQQRVALARAIIVEPRILLLDEPLGALDRGLREEMQREIRTLQRALGLTTVMVTHDQEEAIFMSDEIAVMKDGRIEQTDKPLVIYDRPRTEFVARFMGIRNFLRGRIVSSRGPTKVDIGGTQFTATGADGLSAGCEVLVAARPGHIRLADAADQTGIAAAIVSVEEIGDLIIYQVAASERTIEVHEPRSRKSARRPVGAAVRLAFDPDETIVIAG
jgi:ABC-type Fe3+/spermidine/putrescine transport system ATPase subunit